ncbi:MAG: signal peptidase II [Clostridia bacterium]|nr:signal peptidase II [Clostridia bacterium]
MVAISLIIAALLVVVDQLIKIIIDLWLVPQGEVVVIDGLFSLAYVENTGAAWGALDGKRWLLIVVAAVAVCVIVYMLIKGKIKGVCYNVATVMLLAGGLGNLIDRFCRGYVIDYIRTLFIDFPVYNFADILITIGAGFLIVKLLQELIVEFRADRAKKRGDKTDDEADEPCDTSDEVEF